MAAMLVQVPLPQLPGSTRGRAERSVVARDSSGVVWVRGLATFAWDTGMRRPGAWRGAAGQAAHSRP